MAPLCCSQKAKEKGINMVFGNYPLSPVTQKVHNDQTTYDGSGKTFKVIT